MAGARVLGRLRVGVGLLVVAGTLAACGGGSSGDSASSRPAAPAGFSFDAARLCTDVINDGLDYSSAEADMLVVRILQHRRDRTQPDAAELDEWKALLQERDQQLTAAHDRLQQLRSADSTEQSNWEQVIESGPLQARGLRERVELIETGDWERINREFMGLSYGSGRTVDAARRLNLDWSDCSIVYATSSVGADRRDFVRAATPACNTIAIRRIAQNYEADQRVVLDAVAQVITSEGLPQPGTEDSLRRVVAEWEATVADLEAVDGDVDVPKGWQQIVDTAKERQVLAQSRLTALESGDQVAIDQAFDRKVSVHAGFEFEDVGIKRPSCAAVRS